VTAGLEALTALGLSADDARALIQRYGSDPGQLEAVARQRAEGTPLAYLLGTVRFMGLELEAAPGALVPREETELLGRTAVELLSGRGPAPTFVDMCCGSGNLACGIAAALPAARAWATDLTDATVALARRNVERLGLSDRVQVRQGDLFSALGDVSGLDAVVCNPPYISTSRLGKDRAALLEHEPKEAFDGGPYGLSIHQRVIREALPYLKPDGLLLFELGQGQERQLKLLFQRVKDWGEVRQVQDASGAVRVVWSQRRS
jgi:release factor glutamine methyltransferase